MRTYYLHRREFNKADITRSLPSSENSVWKSAIVKEVTGFQRKSRCPHFKKHRNSSVGTTCGFNKYLQAITCCGLNGWIIYQVHPSSFLQENGLTSTLAITTYQAAQREWGNV